MSGVLYAVAVPLVAAGSPLLDWAGFEAFGERRHAAHRAAAPTAVIAGSAAAVIAVGGLLVTGAGATSGITTLAALVVLGAGIAIGAVVAQRAARP